MTEETIFAAALDKSDPAERSAYLDAACAGQPELRRRVEGLLAAHDKAVGFLERPAVAVPEPDAADTRAYDRAGTDSPTLTHGEGTDDDRADALAFLAPPRRPDSLGRIGHYEVLEVLGRGGFGVVFRAFDEVLQRVVAVKMLAPSMAATSPARRRFLREARAAAQVHHPNVVQIHATEESPLPYLVMEFIPGETLQQRSDRTGPLDLADVLRIGRQVAEGLAAAHATGLIHRDIKPSNILIDDGPQQHVKITDFGLARAADDASLTRSGVVAGTPMYMAPEQAKGEALDHRADLFSLGSVLYLMASGRPPFRASTTLAVLKRVAEDTPRPIREIIPEVPEWLCRIVEKLHAKDPAQRFQSAREVADVLADCEQQLKTHGALRDYSRIPGGMRPPRRRRRLGRWELAAAIFLPVLAGLFVLAAPVVKRYLNNQGEVEFEPDPGWQSVIVLQNGAPVTDWLDVRLNPTIKLPPGHYTLNPGFRSPTETIVRWEVNDCNLAGFRGVTTSFNGAACELDVKRGRRVVIRAVTLTRPMIDPDNEALQGTWVAEKIEFQGKQLPEEDCRQFRLVVNGAQARLSLPGGRSVDGKFSLDTTRFPREIDIVGADNKWVRGVYQVSINTLTLCIGDIDRERPLAFVRSLDPNSKQMLVILRRVTVTDKDGWVQLFNGKDLTGWKVHPQAPGHWRVDGDGVLTGSGPVSYLFSDRSDFADFHLRAECRINAGGDSGVFFRCEYGLNQERFGAWVEPRGYEAGINHGNPGYLTGNLYGPDSNRPILQKVAEDVTEADRWFTLEVVAQGNRIKVMVDKKILVDYVDLDRLYTRGHIALQGGPGRRTVVQFRKIEIKELPAEKDAAPDYALEFDGKTSHVLVEGLGRDAAGPFTLEAYVTPARLLSNPEGPQVIMGVGGPFSVAFSQYGARWRMHEGGPDGGFWLYAKPDTAEVGKRVHVAAVYDGKQRRFYVNGRASFATEVAAGKIQPQAVTVLGRTIGDMGGHFQGVIDEVRISKVARYDKDFTPDKRFEPDKDTLALYHCDEGRGEVLKDSSGNGHHGKIVGAKWANADGTPIKPAAPEPPGAQALRDLVAAKERTRDTVKLRVEAGKDSPLDLVAAEVELVEARIRLAQAEADKAGVVSLLEKLVAQRQEQRRLTQIRVEEGIDAPALLDDTDARVADAKARLEKARAEVPPGATPAPRSKE